MRILFANKFWYRRGGLERVMFDEIRWLEDGGHQIAHFSTAHPENCFSPWAQYFVPYLDLGQGANLSARQKVRAGLRLFHNREAARRFARLLKEFRPDLIHVHGIHRQISPSILDVARRSAIPVVQSLHDYHHICPADTLLLQSGEVCTPRRCGNMWFGPCVSGRCLHGSLTASVLAAAETTWAQTRRVYAHGIARFVSPSSFLAEQMLGSGWRTPTDVIPNAVPVEPTRCGTGQGFAIIGRLAREKGVEPALRAARKAGVQVTVAGEGPLRKRLEAEFSDITFTGHLDGDEVLALTRRCRAVIVPSVGYENAPMSVLEPMASAVPVIASRIGGIPEQITHGVNGLLVAPGHVAELAAAMERLENDPALAEELGLQARRTVETRFSADLHVRALESTYLRCLRP